MNVTKLKKIAWSVFKWAAFIAGVLALLAVMQLFVLTLMIEGYL